MPAPSSGSSASSPAQRPDSRSVPQLIAAAVVSLEAIAMFGFGVWLAVELVVATPSNRNVAVMSMTFFLVIGLAVGVVALSAWMGKRWVFGPIIFVQLLGLPVAYDMLQGGFVVGALLLGVAALAVIGALVSPSGRTAFNR